MNLNVIAAAYLLAQPHSSKIVADLEMVMDGFSHEDYQELGQYLESGTFIK